MDQGPSPADALPFVNWLFWATLATGTLAVVAGTELLGGTTRGYRLFMAFLVTGFAAVLLVSDLNLPETVGESDRHLRTVLFCAGCALYLAASLARLPRSWLGLATSAAGIAAIAAEALTFTSADPVLFLAQLVVAAVALGAVNASMLLGHWYLVTPRLSPLPLRRMMLLLLGSLVVQAVGFGYAVVAVGHELVAGPMGWLAWLRLLAGTLLPVGITVLAILASRSASLQATTRLLYVGLALIIAGSIAGSSITYLTGVPI